MRVKNKFTPKNVQSLLSGFHPPLVFCRVEFIPYSILPLPFVSHKKKAAQNFSDSLLMYNLKFISTL